MGVPLAGDYDVAVTRPIDSRMVWTGNASNLNNIPNKFPGLISYTTGDQNLYLFRNDQTWEKVVTNNVDSYTAIQDPISNQFDIEPDFNGQVIYVSSTNIVSAFIKDPPSIYPNGFNVTFLQIGEAPIKIERKPIKPSNFSIIENRLGLSTTAGKYAVASLLKISNTNTFVLYGDLV
jgi:hypothetical protein